MYNIGDSSAVICSSGVAVSPNHIYSMQSTFVYIYLSHNTCLTCRGNSPRGTNPGEPMSWTESSEPTGGSLKKSK
mgnify:CR=1 FL=1